MIAPLLLWLASAAAPAPAEGVVAGRLAISEDRKPVPLSRVQEVLRAAVGLELRRGRKVISAQLHPEGFFVARAPPGRYRLEYLTLGDRAEFFAPHELEVRSGALHCAGTLSLSVERLESLGANARSRLALADDCGRMMPRLRALAGWSGKEAVRRPARAPREEPPRARSPADLLLGLRAEASVNGSELALRGWYVFPLVAALGEPGAVTLHLSGGRVTGPSPGHGVELAAGAGVNLFGLLELIGAAGVRVGLDGFPSEPLAAAIARAGFAGAGLDFRAQWTLAGPALFVGVDVAPFFLLGSLL